MKKILKKVTTMCCATVMAASMMTMNVGAADGYTYLPSPYSVKNTVPAGVITSYGKVTKSTSGEYYNISSYASTGINKSTGGATVSICIYYTKSNGSTGSTGNGSSGQSGASTSKTINKKTGVYRYSKNSHLGYGKNTRTVKLYKK